MKTYRILKHFVSKDGVERGWVVTVKARNKYDAIDRVEEDLKRDKCTIIKVEAKG